MLWKISDLKRILSLHRGVKCLHVVCNKTKSNFTYVDVQGFVFNHSVPILCGLEVRCIFSTIWTPKGRLTLRQNLATFKSFQELCSQ